MNRKLRKALKEIYASDKPAQFPEFLKEIQKERNKRNFRFVLPVCTAFFVFVIAGYGYFSIKNYYRPEKDMSTVEKQAVVSENTETESSIPSTELSVSTTTAETYFTTIQTTCTTYRTETAVTVTSVPQTHLPVQTRTESIP